MSVLCSSFGVGLSHYPLQHGTTALAQAVAKGHMETADLLLRVSRGVDRRGVCVAAPVVDWMHDMARGGGGSGRFYLWSA